MLTQFSSLKSIVKIKHITIDNVGFKLHYRATCYILLIATILVTSRQYIGEHIKCMADSGVPSNLIDTYCFFTTTFTIPEYYDEDLLQTGAVPHPGVGPMIPSPISIQKGSNSTGEEKIVRHAYYQWVPFVLFLQSIMFYIPHMFWKKVEGGTIRRLAEGLRIGIVAEKEAIQVGGIKVISRSEMDARMGYIKEEFYERRHMHKSWSYWLMLCEILNLLNVALQIYVTDKFLSGRFYDLGSTVVDEGGKTSSGVLEYVFPKVTKCTFHKYGPSGTIQSHDAMCVMALNVINEKIYVFLWFWYVFLFAASVAAVAYRAVCFVLCSTCWKFDVSTVRTKLINARGRKLPFNTYSDYLFMSYLSSNMDPLIFNEIQDVILRDANCGDVDDDCAEKRLYNLKES